MGDSKLETVSAPVGVEVTIETDVIARCPVDDGVDRYSLEVRVLCDGQNVEAQSLQDYLDSFANERVSQEALTHRIGQVLEKALPDARLTVTTTGEHAGISHTVSAL